MRIGPKVGFNRPMSNWVGRAVGIAGQDVVETVVTVLEGALVGSAVDGMGEKELGSNGIRGRDVGLLVGRSVVGGVWGSVSIDGAGEKSGLAVV
jgi:hypothetical protein